MSWEGYSQNICKNGHYFTADETFLEEEPVCKCGSKRVWKNIVDETNGSILEDIFPVETLVMESEVYETCSLGHRHLIKEAIYRTPTKEEMEAFKGKRDRAYEKALETDF